MTERLDRQPTKRIISKRDVPNKSQTVTRSNDGLFTPPLFTEMPSQKRTYISSTIKRVLRNLEYNSEDLQLPEPIDWVRSIIKLKLSLFSWFDTIILPVTPCLTRSMKMLKMTSLLIIRSKKVGNLRGRIVLFAVNSRNAPLVDLVVP